MRPILVKNQQTGKLPPHNPQLATWKLATCNWQLAIHNLQLTTPKYANSQLASRISNLEAR